MIAPAFTGMVIAPAILAANSNLEASDDKE
jgi:hypothetical protein